MFNAIVFPIIDPVIFQVGPISFKWYGLAYALGLLIGIYMLRKLALIGPRVLDVKDADDFLTWACLGVLLGGRIGYIVFYKPFYYLQNLEHIFYVWEGGMSFHGGFLGVAVAAILFAKRRKLNFLKFCDMLSCVAPIGLFFGRIANFINQELVGRVSDMPWAVVFPQFGIDPRHPSQLYEAMLEGGLLFLIVNSAWRNAAIRGRAGVTAGVFVCGYGICRSFVEIFRLPDQHIGYLFLNTTLGQWLSIPMILVGLYLVISSKRR